MLGSRGGGAALAFHHQPGAYDTDSLIGALEGAAPLARRAEGDPAVGWAAARRSHAMGAWLRRERSWLVVEPLPADAPERNPVEGPCSSLKGMELANLAGNTLEEVIAAAERGIQRTRGTHHLPFSFLRYCGLSLR